MGSGLDARPSPSNGAHPWVVQSGYVPARDGTPLAVYVFRPHQGGRAVQRPLPVLWTLDRYHQVQPRPGRLDTLVAQVPALAALLADRWDQLRSSAPQGPCLDNFPWVEGLVARGYVIAIADARGTGASMGPRPGPFSELEVDDARVLMAWLCDQPWCDGNLGMFGRSYCGIAQLMAASTGAPGLRAIMPQMPMLDLYDFGCGGGIFRGDFARAWAEDVAWADRELELRPVDDDPDGTMLARARASHAGNRDPHAMFAGLDWRDDVDPISGEAPWQTRTPARWLSAIQDAALPTYLVSGWLDVWCRDALLWYANLRGPRKLLMGPWGHTASSGIDLGEEHRRWFDHWLKGIASGVLDEMPIHYYVMGAPRGQGWQATDAWPLPHAERWRLWAHGEHGGDRRGRLAPATPTTAMCLELRVDLGASSGAATRWTNGRGGALRYEDLSANDARGICVTSEPLEEPRWLVGHPLAILWIEADHDEADVLVYLERVEPDGSSHYVTEGALRCSHRGLGPAPYDALGLPHHPCTRSSRLAMPPRPVELRIDLHPTATFVPAGQRLRLAIHGADHGNADVPSHRPVPTLRLWCGPDHPSRLELAWVEAP